MKTVLGAIGFDPEAPVIQEIKLKFPANEFHISKYSRA